MYDRLSIQCNLVNSNLYTVVTKCLCWKSPFMVYFYCVVSIPLWMWVKHQQIQSWILYTLSITTVNVGETPADSILNIIYTFMYHCECGWSTSRLNLEYYIHCHSLMSDQCVSNQKHLVCTVPLIAQMIQSKIVGPSCFDITKFICMWINGQLLL